MNELRPTTRKTKSPDTETQLLMTEREMAYHKKDKQKIKELTREIHARNSRKTLVARRSNKNDFYNL